MQHLGARCGVILNVVDLLQTSVGYLAEVDGGKKLEACLADFGLSALLPPPQEQVNSKLL